MRSANCGNRGVRFGSSDVSGGGYDVIGAKNGQQDDIDGGAGNDAVTFDDGLDIVAENREEQNT